MFRFVGFTLKSVYAINNAIDMAQKDGCNEVSSLHLLYGILNTSGAIGSSILKKYGATAKELEDIIQLKCKKSVQHSLSPDNFSQNVKEILEASKLESKNMGLILSGTEHILLACINTIASNSFLFMIRHGISRKAILSYLSDENIKYNLPQAKSTQNINHKECGGYDKMARPTSVRCEILDKYGIDLTAKAECGDLDPVFCRDSETERVIEILMRRNKNNPCLIGDAGVGKTAIVEGLAQRIINGTVPEPLKNTRLVAVDITLLLSGTRYRGDFEERMHKMLCEVERVGNIILFIDEIHLIVSAGKAEGISTDAANILKPQLARGKIRIIGATTTKEYKMSFKNDSALERRFQNVMVDELSSEKTIDVLRAIRPKYESFHKLKISDEAIISAVNLSVSFDTGRRLPDKAIDLIDEASAYKNIYRSSSLLEAHASPFKYHSSIKLPTVDKNDIITALSKSTGISVDRIKSSEKIGFSELENEISKQIVGQQYAVSKVSAAISRSRAGIRSKNRPISSFIFAGTSGIGKTYMCSVLSSVLFGNTSALIRLDMSEYSESFSVSRLIGTPPGYQGYEKGGELTDKISSKPYSIVLFDEIEKAHPQVINLLLQILDEGAITDGGGNKVSFKDSIIIMTTNGNLQSSNVGFLNGDNDTFERDMKNSLKTIFRPELLNRVDEIIVFNNLKNDELIAITKKELDKLIYRLKEKEIYLSYSDDFPEKLAVGFAEVHSGARPIRRTIENRVENIIAKGILSGDVLSGATLECRMDKDNKVEILCTSRSIVSPPRLRA